ncbi:thiamine pyrophosphokinase [Vallitalea longa]|uniref:Thiamine diphosphokinase n=1 Tax=Vallitalea longa TaxID=2936439 RepID=A0A9W6DHL7_9FIRM|nr:thiamine diphosphokinase [Vallitalea longa]GKX31697.1 thiamine pyrophosphokinase [Vallitalea longa]
MKTLIVTGGTIDLDFLKKFTDCNRYDYIIGVDKGAQYMYNINLKPNLVVGDFDSIDPKIIDTLTHDPKILIDNFIAEKDETDTHLAIMKAIDMGSTHIDIFGGIGSRMDHTLANIHILMIPLEKNVKCRIINKNNIITLIDVTTSFERSDYKYISLIPLTNEVSGITTAGLKYPLFGYTMKKGISIGVSNEFTEKQAKICIKEGILIVIRSRD